MSFLGNIFRSINPPLPKFNSLDEGIDYLLYYVGGYSDSLGDKQVYIEKRWVEVRDQVDFQENVLHVFRENGTYNHILNGDISAGSWELAMGGFVWKFGGRNELYQLVFLNEDFFILKKQGNHYRAPRKYVVLVQERLARGKEWTDLLDVLYELYKGNSNYILLLVMFFIAVAVLFFFSLQ
jgi:hypothetical protein